MKTFSRCLFFAGSVLVLAEVALALGSRAIVAKLWDLRMVPLADGGYACIANRDWPKVTNSEDEEELISFSNELSKGALVILSLGDLFSEYPVIAASPGVFFMITAVFGLRRLARRRRENSAAPTADRSSWKIAFRLLVPRFGVKGMMLGVLICGVALWSIVSLWPAWRRHQATSELRKALFQRNSPEGDVGELMKAILDFDEAIWKVKSLDGGECAVPVLVEGLRDYSELIRLRALVGLIKIGAPAKDAGPAVSELLNDPSKAVRESAALTLKRLQRQSQDEQ